ncbi:hypothetical protein GIB67_016668 [Kingdonia uniflora]|uniref:F-box protein At5g52880-like ARM repeats region domain-containing protein n=1 Tax=Kingdonia uniflora TaxID=39325 RepID=A0A7J7ME38_9MAGN|nr:hypothetical protein GIB67_016668 [Kingdonia uniflora]
MVNCYSHPPATVSDDAPFTVMLMKITRPTFSSGNKVQTRQGMSAANLFLQAADASLPRQKRVSAIKEFKHVVVAHKKVTIPRMMKKIKAGKMSSCLQVVWFTVQKINDYQITRLSYVGGQITPRNRE